MKTQGDTLRLFVAIPAPDEVRAALRAVQAELKEILPARSTTWTRDTNMHLTLRFLGEVGAAKVEVLKSKLREAAAGAGAIDLICERLGCFPDLRFPRVVWAWVHDEADRLAELYRRVNSAISEFAEKPAEERFTGHITLARPTQIKRAEAERLAHFVENAVTRQFGKWRCDSIELIRSELSSAGSRYTTLDVVPL